MSLTIDEPTLARIAESVEALSDPVRRISSGALQYYIADTKAYRKREAALWSRVLGITTVLLLLIAASVVHAFKLHRQLRRQYRTLEETASNTRMVYEASMLGVIVTNLQGEVQLFNKAAETLFGCRSNDVLGRNVTETIVPKDQLALANRAIKSYQIDISHKASKQGLFKGYGLHADGHEIALEISISRTQDISGRRTLVMFLRDISQQVAFEEGLLRARDEARQHAASKLMFLATMSHEMRTPMHGLLASLDLIDEHNLAPDVRDLLGTARDCSRRSLQQINDVLEISQISGKHEGLTAFSPRDLVERIVSELTALAHNQNTRLSISLTGASEAQLWVGMPKTLARVLYNLIGNAVKFTSNGEVSVALRFEPETDGTAQLYIEVKDNGIGISPENCAKVFDMFFSLSNQETHSSVDHTGLGLVIAKAGVDKMGGELRVTSQVGVGSCFYFDVPLVLSKKTNSKPRAEDALYPPVAPDFHCLVVDDNRVNLVLTAAMLTQIGCRTTIANSGVEAIGLAADARFDVVFMDLNMPNGIGGAEAANAIRGGSLNRTTTIVALTADTTFGAPTQLDASALDCALHKPVTKSDLRQLLAGLPVPCAGHTVALLKAETISSGFDRQSLDLADLESLIGKDKTRDLLVAVADDIERVLYAITPPQPDAPDILHHAIGSTGAVGLASLSDALRQAEHLFRMDVANEDLSSMISALKSEAELARGTIDHALTRLFA